jgi:hypothetical protein
MDFKGTRLYEEVCSLVKRLESNRKLRSNSFGSTFTPRLAWGNDQGKRLCFYLSRLMYILPEKSETQKAISIQQSGSYDYYGNVSRCKEIKNAAKSELSNYPDIADILITIIALCEESLACYAVAFPESFKRNS